MAQRAMESWISRRLGRVGGRWFMSISSSLIALSQETPKFLDLSITLREYPNISCGPTSPKKRGKVVAMNRMAADPTSASPRALGIESSKKLDPFECLITISKRRTAGPEFFTVRGMYLGRDGDESTSL